MGLLVDGNWQDEWYDTKKSKGEFVRQTAKFRDWITATGEAGPNADGAPGLSGKSGYKAEADRYHLYVSQACPWAHRTVIFRKLKGLEELIGLTIVHPHMLENGWEIRDDGGNNIDPLHGRQYLHQVYTSVVPDMTGRVTVPVLWDKKTNTIVSNESSEIIRMFNSAFNGLTGNTDDYYPADLRGEIDTLNERVYHTVNNGVYRCGFATRQDAYEKAFADLFDSLEWLEKRLGEGRYLFGNRLTEADWRLFTMLIRFDSVYHGHFKTNLKRIEDYPNLSAYLRDLYQHPGVKETVDFRHIKEHYYVSQRTINPTQVVPVGPHIDYDRPHGRG